MNKIQTVDLPMQIVDLPMQIVDLHCDTISVIKWVNSKENEKIHLRNNNLSISIDKMMKGKYLLQTFAMFIPLKKVNDPYLEVKDMIKIHTHQYSKRQYTWFRNQMNVKWVNVEVNNFDNTINEAKKLIDDWDN